jgi:aspartate beta-hydroxylase
MSLYERGAQLVRHIYDKRIDGPPILDAASYFPDATKFAAAWRDIRAEADAVVRHFKQIPRFHDLMPEQADISANDGRDWRLYVLKAYGVGHPQHMAACPVLARIVADAPDVLSASLSFMESGKHVPAHRGPFRGVIRFYMGLSVPRHADGTPAVLLKIDGADYRVGDGEWLLWDDTYRHEVWNGGDDIRSVLLLDVARRSMPADMRLLSSAVIAAIAAGVRWRGVG